IHRITGRRRRPVGGGVAPGGCDALLAVIPGDPRLAGPVSGTVFPVDRPLIEATAALVAIAHRYRDPPAARPARVTFRRWTGQARLSRRARQQSRVRSSPAPAS